MRYCFVILNVGAIAVIILSIMRSGFCYFKSMNYCFVILFSMSYHLLFWKYEYSFSICFGYFKIRFWNYAPSNWLCETMQLRLFLKYVFVLSLLVVFKGRAIAFVKLKVPMSYNFVLYLLTNVCIWLFWKNTQIICKQTS